MFSARQRKLMLMLIGPLRHANAGLTPQLALKNEHAMHPMLDIARGPGRADVPGNEGCEADMGMSARDAASNCIYSVASGPRLGPFGGKVSCRDSGLQNGVAPFLESPTGHFVNLLVTEG